MKITREAISEEVADVLREEAELGLKINTREWISSHTYWDEKLHYGNLKPVMIWNITQHRTELSDKIRGELAGVLPNHEYKDFSAMLYLWPKGSGINTHSDHGYLAGATVYLNKGWKIDWGGHFMWTTATEDPLYSTMWMTINPEFRTLVLNDEAQYHRVSKVAQHAPEMRATLQIFIGENLDGQEGRELRDRP